MTARTATAAVGLLTLAFGLLGLFYPERVMGFVGFMPVSPAQVAGALGETRAQYGGAFVVLGGATLWAAGDPRTHRGTLLLIGLFWLAHLAGRTLGASVDGNPGLFGWLSAVLEAVAGSVLAAAPYVGADSETAASPPAS